MSTGILIVILSAAVAAETLIFYAIWLSERRVRRRGPAASARALFAMVLLMPGLELGAITAATLFLGACAASLFAEGRVATALRGGGAMLFLLVGTVSLLQAALIWRLTKPGARDDRPIAASTPDRDGIARWPAAPEFVYRGGLRTPARRVRRRKDSLAVTAGGVYAFAGRKPRRFLRWSEIASISEWFTDMPAHWMAARDLTIEARDGSSLLITAGLSNGRRLQRVLLFHAHRLGVPLLAVDQRARSIAAATAGLWPDEAKRLRRTPVVTPITALWQTRLSWGEPYVGPTSFAPGRELRLWNLPLESNGAPVSAAPPSRRSEAIAPTIGHVASPTPNSSAASASQSCRYWAKDRRT